MVSTIRLNPTAKNVVGGKTSFSSLIRNARTPDLDIDGLLRTFCGALSQAQLELATSHQNQEKFPGDAARISADARTDRDPTSSRGPPAPAPHLVSFAPQSH